MAELFANNGDPDQTPHSVVSDLGLHCLPVTLLRVSRLKWVKLISYVNGPKKHYQLLVTQVFHQTRENY